MKNKATNGSSQWCIEFFSSDDWEVKVNYLRMLLSEYENSGLRYLNSCVEYFTTNHSYTQIGLKYGGVTPERARQLVRKGYLIIRRGVSCEKQFELFQKLNQLYRDSGFHDYPTFMKIYKPLDSESDAAVRSPYDLLDLDVRDFQQIYGKTSKLIDYVMTMQRTLSEQLNTKDTKTLLVEFIR